MRRLSLVAVPVALIALAAPATAFASSNGGSSLSPEWSALAAFPIALGALTLAALILFRQHPAMHHLKQPLEHLEVTWSFKESWVSNVTVVGGLLTGLFGSSDVLTALLGSEAKSSVALATVASATAVVFTTAGPVIVASTRSRVGNFVTVGGLLAAAVVTLAGAVGELWALYRSGQALDLGGWQEGIVVGAALAFLLLGLYAVRSLLATITQGITPPEAQPPSDTILAARLIVEALKAQENVNDAQVDQYVASFTDSHPEIATSRAAPPRHRRAAIL
jgi:hypothetical protein